VGKGYMIKISPFPPPSSFPPSTLSHCDMKKHKLLNQFHWKQGFGIRVEVEHHLFVGYSSWVWMVVKISKLLQLLWRSLFLGFCVCGCVLFLLKVYTRCWWAWEGIDNEINATNFGNRCSCYVMFALWNALVLGLWQAQAYPINVEVFHQDYK
jgi:hypothetical protein